jgi:hypothetical protein
MESNMGTSAPFRLSVALAGWGLLLAIGLVAGCKLGSFPKPQFPQFAAGKGPFARMMGKKKDEPAAPPSLHFDEGDPADPDAAELLAQRSGDTDSSIEEPDVRELAALDSQPPSRDRQPTQPAGTRPPYRAPATDMVGSPGGNRSPSGDKSGFPPGSESISGGGSTPKTGAPIRRPYDVADASGDRLKSAAADLARDLDRNVDSISSRANDAAEKLPGGAGGNSSSTTADSTRPGSGGNQFTLPGEPGERAIPRASQSASTAGSDPPRPAFALPPVDAPLMGQPLAPRASPKASGSGSQVAASGPATGLSAPGFQMPSSSAPPNATAPPTSSGSKAGMDGGPADAVARLSALPQRGSSTAGGVLSPAPMTGQSGEAYVTTGPAASAAAVSAPGVNSQWQNLPNTGAAPFTPLSSAPQSQGQGALSPAAPPTNQSLPGVQTPPSSAPQSAALPEALRNFSGTYAPGSTRVVAPAGTTWR